MPLKRMARIVMLAALCISLRFAFMSFPNVKPISAIFFVSMSYFQRMDSLWVMSLTMLGSSLLMGFGVVVLWQILTFAILMCIWSWLIKRLSLSIFLESIVVGILIFFYGALISLPYVVQYQMNFVVYWLNGLAFDIAHAVSTILFYPIIYSIFRRIFTHEKIN
ncbi:TPA: hypothetical protein ACGOVD_001101 [Streptococcus suis]